jgi:hypothetical protein
MCFNYFFDFLDIKFDELKQFFIDYEMGSLLKNI